MLMRPFVTLFALSLIGWIAYIIISSDPKIRLERSCAPVGWFGKVAVSVTDLFTDSMSLSVQEFVNSREMDCRYVVWRQFFEEDYIKQQQQIKEIRIQLDMLKKNAVEQEAAIK